MVDNKMGKMIAKIRKQNNMTQKDVASYLGVSDKAVSKWERGESYPEITILPQLAHLLDVSIDELIAGEDQIDLSSAENKDTTYKYLLEDSQIKYLQNTIKSYLFMSFGVILGAALLYVQYNIGHVIAMTLGLSGIVYYGFVRNRLITALRRIEPYLNIDEKKYENTNILFYDRIWLGITFFMVLLIVCDSLLPYHYIFESNYLFLSRNINLPILFVLIGSNMLLAIMYHRKGNDMHDDKSAKKLMGISFVSFLLSFCITAIMIGYKVNLVIHFNKNGLQPFFYYLIPISVVLFFNAYILIKNKCDQKKSWYTLIFNTAQIGILVWGAQHSIKPSSYSSNVLGWVKMGHFYLYLITAVTILHTEWLVISKNREAD